mmetsp:Transcript_6994/g.12676  ORF Transcript_6994/g.12676 Transcript_6994/m.12676 type:complete len:205 (+) Transcript_6994:1216-1830(+)
MVSLTCHAPRWTKSFVAPLSSWKMLNIYPLISSPSMARPLPRPKFKLPTDVIENDFSWMAMLPSWTFTPIPLALWRRAHRTKRPSRDRYVRHSVPRRTSSLPWMWSLTQQHLFSRSRPWGTFPPLLRRWRRTRQMRCWTRCRCRRFLWTRRTWLRSLHQDLCPSPQTTGNVPLMAALPFSMPNRHCPHQPWGHENLGGLLCSHD